MADRYLVTGSAGLIGRALMKALAARGDEGVPFDLVDGDDVRDPARVAAAIRGVRGVVHLAAVSRVVWGEQDPTTCKSTNLEGTRNVLRAARAVPERPFVLFASSREVYGDPSQLPVDEDFALRPVNVYGRTKVQGELLTRLAAVDGLHTGILRLSNVYGDPHDHVDRVVPAFVRAALAGGELRVDGADHLFDFTYLPDVVDGWLRAIDAARAGEELPPLHLVSGEGVRLGDLAQLAILAAGPTGATAREAPPRTYDVVRFVGDPRRAAERLGWRARTPIAVGVAALADAIRREAAVRRR